LKNFERYKIAIDIAFGALLTNGLRSILTALGIIFGVAAVIAMLAIGEGAKIEIMEQIKMVGVNNIVIEKIVIKHQGNKKTKSGKEKFSPGLSVSDVLSIERDIPSVKFATPIIKHKTFASSAGKGMEVFLKGVSTSFFNMFDYSMVEGTMFTKSHQKNNAPVCVIGTKVAAKLFRGADPVGKKIKCKHLWFEVIGVYKTHTSTKSIGGDKGYKDANAEIFAPYSTLLMRYKNPTLLTEVLIKRSLNDEDDMEGPAKTVTEDHHQIDQIIVQVNETSQLNKTGEILARFLKRRHKDVLDFSIEIPELLLKQQQKSKNIFNVLLVGGIGIMNIMLASVMERIKEIGLRISLGARKTDIVSQFLFESMFLSIGGGIIGILLGVSMSKIVTYSTGILTVITFSSVLISFGVSGAVGLIFGLMPAKRASEQNPVISLRS